MADDDPTKNPPVDDPEQDNPDMDDSDDDEDEGNPDDSDPVKLKAERDKLRTTYAKVKAERTRLRQELAQLKEAKPKPDEEDKKPDPDARTRRLAGVAALTEAGLDRRAAKVAVKLLDLSGVSVDEDGDVDEDELDEAVESLKELLPGLFAKASDSASGRPRPPRVTTADKGRRSSSTDDPTSKTSKALLKQLGLA